MTILTPPPLDTSVASTPQRESGSLGRLGIVAGEGYLPQHVAQIAANMGYEITMFCIDAANHKLLKNAPFVSACHYWRYPMLVQRHIDQAKSLGIDKCVFIGKFNKWMLLRALVMDATTLAAWKTMSAFNDDALMVRLIKGIEEFGITVLPQINFMKDLLMPEGQLTQRAPSEREQQDITFGFTLAKEMGRLDVGQTVVVSNGMVLAAETIEGTDTAIKRTKPFTAKRGGVVVKVAKPDQDQRFDIPTVGTRTLKAMKHAGLKVLAIEAGRTLVVDAPAVAKLADKWGMCVVSIKGDACP